jgi:hypothetical protein
VHCDSGSAFSETILNWVCKEKALREGILIGQSGQGRLIFFLSCTHYLHGDWMQYFVCVAYSEDQKKGRGLTIW